MSEPEGHLSDSLLEAHAAGLAMASAPTEHLARCATCRARLDDARTRVTRPSSSPTTDTSPSHTSVVGPPRELSSETTEKALAFGTDISRYIVLEHLGAGGMGVVYTAYDPTLDRRVALKLLKVEYGATHGQEGLLREAQAMARLSHPNVVAVHDVGSFGSDRVFVAMELVEGQNLKTWQKQEPRSFATVWQAYRDAGEGLAAAHAAGLVHGDFKPDNVLVARDGRVRVTDFGIARAVNDTEGAEISLSDLRTPAVRPLHAQGPRGAKEASRQLPETIVGTLAYMAPEQLAGRHGDERSDQFSFGVSLFESLYGFRPYDLSAPRASRWTAKPAPEGSKVPGWAHKVVMRAISPVPEARFESLRVLLTSMAMDPSVARRRWAWPAGVAVVVLLSGVGLQQVYAAKGRVCQQAGNEIASAWDEGRAQSIERAFGASNAADGREVFALLQKRLQAYASAWSAVRKEACEATRVHGTQSDEMLSLRMECLDGRRQELQTLTDTLTHADETTVHSALQGAYSLGDLSLCSDTTALRARVKPPNSQRVREQVTSERRQLDRAQALTELGKFEEAEQIGRASLQKAQQLGYVPLEAAADSTLGKTVVERGQEKGLVSLTQAVSLGLATADDEVAMRAAVEAALFEADRFRYDEAKRWLFISQPLLSRLGNPLALEVEYLRAAGTAALGDDDSSEIRGRIAQTLQKLEESGRGRDVVSAHLLNVQGLLFDAGGRYDEAISTLERSLQLKTELFGARHHDVGEALLNLSYVAAKAGRFQESLETSELAADIALTANGRHSFLHGSARINVGEAQLYLGKYLEADASFQRALDAFEGALAPDQPNVLMALSDLGESALAQEKPAAAAKYFETELSRRRRRFGASSPELGRCLAQLGLAESLLGHPTAIGYLEAGRSLLEDRLDPVDQAVARFALAQGFWQLPATRTRARPEAEKALELFEKGHLHWRAERVKQWLAAHGASQGG